MTRSSTQGRGQAGRLTVGEPLHRAYSHRDCQLTPPLERSLARGFTYIEVDVFCLAGRLLVAHDLVELRPRRTLRNLYLEPLRQLARSNADRIFSDGTPLTLFVDLKAGAGGYLELLRLAEDYADLVATAPYQPEDTRPLRLILSGSRPSPALVAGRPRRAVLLDGRAPDLGVYTDAEVMPIISDDWRLHFSWRGEGAFPAAESEKLARMIAQAHGSGQQLRFWGTPDAAGPARETVWTTLLDHGIDLLNTDDIEGLEAFLRARVPDRLGMTTN